MRSIATGVKTADEMLKSADVELIMSSPICPGKYVILVSGNVGSVKNAVETGIRAADIFLVESHIINNLDDKVIPALSATTEIKEMKAIGVIETISALTSVKAGDIAVKTSSVELIEIRIARGLGGKGFVVLTGELSSVKSAVKTCLSELKDGGEIVSTSVIPSPHPGLIAKLF